MKNVKLFVTAIIMVVVTILMPVTNVFAGVTVSGNYGTAPKLVYQSKDINIGETFKIKVTNYKEIKKDKIEIKVLENGVFSDVTKRSINEKKKAAKVTIAKKKNVVTVKGLRGGWVVIGVRTSRVSEWVTTKVWIRTDYSELGTEEERTVIWNNSEYSKMHGTHTEYDEGHWFYGRGRACAAWADFTCDYIYQTEHVFTSNDWVIKLTADSDYKFHVGDIICEYHKDGTPKHYLTITDVTEDGKVFAVTGSNRKGFIDNCSADISEDIEYFEISDFINKFDAQYITVQSLFLFWELHKDVKY